LPEDYLETYRDNVEGVSAEDVARVANRYVLPDRMAVVIVGDAGEILAHAEQFVDEIEIFDTDGNRREHSEYQPSASPGPAVDASGRWRLEIDAQGQKLPVELELEQADGALTGAISSVFGSGEITDGKIAGDRVSAKASIDVQGQSAELLIAGKIDGETISGSIETGSPELPAFTFSGRRSNAASDGPLNE
jgi:hypothetical protein